MYRNGDLNQWDFKGQPLNQHHCRRRWQPANQHPRKGSGLSTFLMSSQPFQNCVCRRALQGGKACHVKWSVAGWNKTLQTMPSSDIARGTALIVSEEGVVGVTHVLNHSILCLLDHLLELFKTRQFKKSSKGQIFVNWEGGRECRKKRTNNRQITVWVNSLYFSQFSLIITQKYVTYIIKETHLTFTLKKFCQV